MPIAEIISKHEVLLIQPPLELSRDFVDYPWLDILPTVQAAAILRDSGWKTSILNGLSGPGAEFIEQKDRVWLGRSRTDFLDELAATDKALVMIHAGPWFSYSPSRKWLIEIIKQLKDETDSIIIVADLHQGAMHYVESDASELLDAGADLVQRYEGERFCKNLEEFLHDLEINHVHLYEERELFSLDDIPSPAWDLVDLDEYFKLCNKVLDSAWRPGPYPPGLASLPLLTSRGCPFQCNFCSHGPGLDVKARTKVRSLDLERLNGWLVDWKNKYGIARLVILDDVANLHQERFSDLLNIIQSLDLRLEFPNGLRADLLLPEHLEKLAPLTSGLKVSLESAVERVQKKFIGKNLDPVSVSSVASLCHQLHIPLEVHGIIGVPGERRQEIMETLKFCAAMHKRFGVKPRVQFATPLAGTKMHGLCVENNLIPKEGSWDISSAFSKIPVITTEEFDGEFLKSAMDSFRRKISSSGRKKLIVNLTYRCNNRCIFCAVGDREAKDADVDEVLNNIVRYRKSGFDLLDIDGGEPTLHPGLIELLQKIKRLDFERISLVTNGRRASYARFARRLVATGLDEILVSLHSSDSETQERITNVVGSFAQTVKGIENILEAFGESDPIAVNTTVVNENIASLSSMGDFLISMGVKRWNLQLVTPFGRAKGEQVPLREQASETIGDILEEFSPRLLIHVINTPPCDLPSYEQFALADFEKSDRDMAFVGEKGQNLQSFLASKRRQVDKCSSCPWSLVCPGEYIF